MFNHINQNITVTCDDDKIDALCAILNSLPDLICYKIEFIVKNDYNRSTVGLACITNNEADRGGNQLVKNFKHSKYDISLLNDLDYRAMRECAEQFISSTYKNSYLAEAKYRNYLIARNYRLENVDHQYDSENIKTLVSKEVSFGLSEFQEEIEKKLSLQFTAFQTNIFNKNITLRSDLINEMENIRQESRNSTNTLSGYISKLAGAMDNFITKLGHYSPPSSSGSSVHSTL